ncbi:MAG: hypothetical protein JNM85_11220 [Chthonomonas sp.]|nr:hypothetical protein [Chthonomonas sp.]
MIVSVVLGLCVLSVLGLGWYIRIGLPRELDERYRSSFAALNRALELRFPQYVDMTTQVTELALALGAEMKLSKRDLQALEWSAALRDLGLCSVPYVLINEKNPAQWSDSETASFERHAEVGASLLDLVPNLSYLAPIVRHHHTPYRQMKDAPVQSRILNVVTGYLMQERAAGSVFARDHIASQQGQLYDPAVVRALQAVLSEHYVGTARDLALS